MATNPVRVLSYHKGAQGVSKVITLGNRAVALIHRTSNAGEASVMLATLSAKGELLHLSDPVPLSNPRPGEFVAVNDNTALLGIVNREGYVPSLKPERPDEPLDYFHWFSCLFSGDKIELKALGVWKEKVLLEPNGLKVDGRIAWLMAMSEQVADSSNPPPAPLHYGWSNGLTPPTMRKTMIRAQDFAVASIPGSNEMLAFVNSNWKQMQIFKLGGGSDDSPFMVLSPKSQMKGEVSSPHVVMRPDGYVFIWRYFNKKIKRETRDAGLFFRTCDLKFNSWSEAMRLGPDREIGPSAFGVYNFDDVAVVVWRNGMSKKTTETRYISFRSIAEVGQAPRRFSAPLPAAVVAVGEEKLALDTEYLDQPYGFTLRAWPLPVGFD